MTALKLMEQNMKKLFTFLLLCIATACVAAAFSACAPKAEPHTTHTYGEPVHVKLRTCTEDGLDKWVCTVCGDEKTETIPALGHALSYSHSGEELKHTAHCTRENCGYSAVEDCNMATSTVAPTCTAEGYDSHSCSLCGYEYRDNQKAELGHELGEWQFTGDHTNPDGVHTHARFCTHGCGYSVPGECTFSTRTTDPTCTED